MAKFCIFRIYEKQVEFFESYDDWDTCHKRLSNLIGISIQHDINCRYIMRKLEDFEDPYNYNPYPKFVITYPHNRNHNHNLYGI